MKRVVLINCIALQHKLRSAYWCIHEDNIDLIKKYVKRFDLNVSSKFPRLIYNPKMISESDIDVIFGSDNSKAIGKILGYPSPG